MGHANWRTGEHEFHSSFLTLSSNIGETHAKRRKDPWLQLIPCIPYFCHQDPHSPSPHTLQIPRESKPGCLANATLLRVKLQLWSHFFPSISHSFHLNLENEELGRLGTVRLLCQGRQKGRFWERTLKPPLPLFAPASSQDQESPSPQWFCSTCSLYEIWPPGSDQLFGLRLESLGSSGRRKRHRPLFSQFYL